MSQTIELVLKSTSSFSIESSSATIKLFLKENEIRAKGPYKRPNEHHLIEEERVKFFVRSFWFGANSLNEHRKEFISMIENMPSEIKFETVISDDE